jgi:hypothetical protein
LVKNVDFKIFIDNLIAAFVYRPIMIQKAIQILLAKHKTMLAEFMKETTSDTNHYDNSTAITTTASTHLSKIGGNSSIENLGSKRKCYAIKCQLLHARGIIRQNMLCTNGRSICSGCTIEMAKHRKVLSLENELLQLSIANQYLAPLLEYRYKVITIKESRKILSCLPTFERDLTDNSIFGAARYMANTLGIKVHNSPSSSLIDTPMTDTETRQMWRKASFFCRCQGNITTTTFEVRSFCNSCSCLIPLTTTLSNKICIGCNINEKWEYVWSPCLACQFASIVFRNPFANWFQRLIDTWLPLPLDHDSSSLESPTEEVQLSRECTKTYDTSSIERKKLIRL